MNQIFHPYNLWEDYPNGFYDNLSGKNKQNLVNKVIELFTNPEQTQHYMERVLKEWKYSCEHNLTNLNMNRIAYLGQAACCLYAGVPSSITMEAWNKVPKQNRDEADMIAQKLIENWEIKNFGLCQKLN